MKIMHLLFPISVGKASDSLGSNSAGNGGRSICVHMRIIFENTPKQVLAFNTKYNPLRGDNCMLLAHRP